MPQSIRVVPIKYVMMSLVCNISFVYYTYRNLGQDIELKGPFPDGTQHGFFDYTDNTIIKRKATLTLVTTPTGKLIGQTT